MTSKTTIALYKEHVTNLPETLSFINQNYMDLVVCPIVNPLLYCDYGELRDVHKLFTRPDLILDPTTWITKVICNISSSVDCDSNDPDVRKHSEQTIKQQISFAQHVVQTGNMLIRLKDSNTMNLARIIAKELTGKMFVEIPMINPKATSRSYRSACESNDNVVEDTWHWWNQFRTFSDYSTKIKIALELSADLPSEEELLRWYGEPVELLIIPADIFILNKKNYPVLSRAHQHVVLNFIDLGVNLALKAASGDNMCVRYYVEYLRHLISRNMPDSMSGYDDVLQTPLQPLYDNLDSYTYEIFEKDPIKYISYQRAIEKALIDRISENDIDKQTAIVMVVGAGRGPLVRATINASLNTKRKIKIFVVEKNPNAIITLASLKEEMWSDHDLTIISSDMRHFQPENMADIIVSELLGSLGDNELSPECLDGAQNYLKDDGISIPCSSTSYVNPIMTPRLFSNIRDSYPRPYRTKPSTTESQCETMYVSYIKNAYHIAPPKPLFTFEHPNRNAIIDNSRYEKLTFEIAQDCVLNGFAGYFDTVLYKDVVLSIHPETHSRGLSSWFPMYIPISEPQHLKAGQILEAQFWRCVSERKVWYEWGISAPNLTHVHNLNGRSCNIKK